MSYDGTVAARAPALLRLAHQLLGDADAAAAVVTALLSRRRLRRAVAAGDDQPAVTALARTALHQQPMHPSSPSALDQLPARARVVVVLAFGMGWDATGIAEALGTSTRRVHADVQGALETSSERVWRALLDQDGWDVTPPADLRTRTRLVAGRRRRRRLRAGLAAAAAATCVAGILVAVVRVATAPAPLPPTAHVHGLLSWPPRGGLVRDTHFLDAATRLWRRSAQHPGGRVYVLYAGRVGFGRLAVLQARGADGVGRIAVLGDHDVTFRHPRLMLDAVAPITRTDLPLLTVPYDGNLSIPGLTSGPGSRILQALVAPGVDRVEERDFRDLGERSPRPPYTGHPLHDGLSEDWLDLSGTLPSTAVRAYRQGRIVFTGLVAQQALQPVPVTAHAIDPPANWTGLPRDIPSDVLDDDVVWWAEVCGAADPRVSLVWSGGARAVLPPVRFEFVACPGRPRNGAWLTGSGAGALWVARNTGRTEAYAAAVPPDSLAPFTLVAVGSTRVATVTAQDVTARGRVLYVTARTGAVAPVFARDGAGRRLSVSIATSFVGGDGLVG